MPEGVPPSRQGWTGGTGADAGGRVGRSRVSTGPASGGRWREAIAAGGSGSRVERGATASGSGRGSARAVPARLWAWLGSPDGRAVGVLVVLPVLFFAVPAALGHPAITGDNLIQNFPLRVLTGRQLRQGHLPLWNPLIWSGTPLLGGLNSGSFYPFTFFFAVLAPVAAFVVNLLGVYWAGGLGMYALCRRYGLRPVASFVGALTFAFSGAMSGQLVHIAVIQGMSWMPLLVLAELELSWVVFGTGPATSARSATAPVPGTVSGPATSARSATAPVPGTVSGPAAAPTNGTSGVAPRVEGGRRRSPWPWVALLALMVGLEALTGEPRSMVETEVVGAVVAAWVVLRRYGPRRVTFAKRLRFCGYAVLAGVWGVALAAAELGPGWTFIKASQRAVETYQYFGSGSLHVRWSLLLLVPDLFGGAGHFGSVSYFNRYNLPEVTSYVGMLPLGAALALLVRSFGRRRAARSSDWGLWLALGALGLLLTWGSFTPLGHIWAAVPLLGKTRLQSRNVEIVDLSLAVLFAFWADRALTERTAPARAGRGAGGARGARAAAPSRASDRPRDWRAWLPAVPAAAAVVVCAITLAAPIPVEEWLHATASGAALARGLWPWFLAQAVVAGAIVVLVARWRRLGAPTRRRALVAVVVADLAFFALATSTAIAPPAATLEPSHAAAAAVLGTSGRFAIVDTTVSHLATLSSVGQPDLNVFTGLPSVQGYGSIVSNSYGAPTGSHRLDTVSPCALATGTFGPLRLSTMLVSAGDLAVGTRAVGPVSQAPPAPCPGAPRPGSAHRRTFYLGRLVTLGSATLAVTGSAAPVGTGSAAPVGTGSAAPVGTPKVGIVTADGATRWPAERVRPTPTGWAVGFRRPQIAAGIVVEGPAREIADTSTLQGARGGRWVLDGMVQDAMDTSTWRFTGTLDGGLGIFRRTTPVRPPVWLATPVPGSSVKQVAAPDWGGAVLHVVATRPVTVVWSEAYLAGWHATLTPSGGAAAPGAQRTGTRPMALAVRPHGLIQSVRVPEGRWVLTFHFRPKLLTLGIAGSFAAVAGFLALLAAAIVNFRRRRRAPLAGAALGAPGSGDGGLPGMRDSGR